MTDQSSKDLSAIYACSVCNKYTNKICGNCETIYYCSDQCRAIDWEKHRYICDTAKITLDMTNELKRIIESAKFISMCNMLAYYASITGSTHLICQVQKVAPTEFKCIFKRAYNPDILDGLLHVLIEYYDRDNNGPNADIKTKRDTGKLLYESHISKYREPRFPEVMRLIAK